MNIVRISEDNYIDFDEVVCFEIKEKRDYDEETRKVLGVLGYFIYFNMANKSGISGYLFETKEEAHKWLQCVLTTDIAMIFDDPQSIIEDTNKERDEIEDLIKTADKSVLQRMIEIIKAGDPN